MVRTAPEALVKVATYSWRMVGFAFILLGLSRRPRVCPSLNYTIFGPSENLCGSLPESIFFGVNSWKLQIKAVPNASKDEICGWLGEELKIRVAAPPEQGKANGRIVGLLAQFLQLPESHIRIVSGHSSARKAVEINGSSLNQLRAKLAEKLPK